MSKKSDDSIERIFRQAVTKYDTTFEASDWLKMEKLLDEEVIRRAAARSKRTKGTAFTLTGLTGLIIAVYFLAFKNPSDSTARLNRLSTEEQASGNFQRNGGVKTENSSDGLLSSEDSTKVKFDQKTNVLNNNTLKESSKNISKIPSSTATLGAEKLNSVATDKKGSTSENKVSVFPLNTEASKKDNRPTSSANEPSRDGNHQPALTQEPAVNNPNQLTNEYRNSTNEIGVNKSFSVAELSGAKKSNQEILPIGEESEIPNDDRSSTTKDASGPKNNNAASLGYSVSSAVVSTNVIQDEFNSMEERKGGSALQSDSLALEKDKEERKVDSVNENSKSINEGQQKKKPASRWSVGIVFGPEFSTTRLNHYSSPGESIGLRIGYQLSNRFNINTGIIRSTKKYKDGGDEYNPNPGYWRNRTNGIVPEEIDSKCVVYELPVDIQFDLIQTAKNRLFISTGVSSYFMMSQAYRYNFETPNPGAVSDWETSQSESYWFGVGMISAGYERNIHPTLSLGIEPYLKASFTEIGWPNIKLFSAGAYVTLRYKFMTRKSADIK